MRGGGAARARSKPRTLEERIAELQKRADAKKKSIELQAKIKQAKLDLQALRHSRK
jgi:hypothetical protein